MTQLLSILRLDSAAWDRYDRAGSFVSAILTTVGAYALLAFDRFGAQGFLAPRGPVRMVLVGFYGWMFLAGAAWLIAKTRHQTEADLGSVVRLYGFVHLPMMALAVVVQVLSVSLQLFTPAGVLAAFTFVVWMPALSIAAARQAFGFEINRAALAGLAPYLVWVSTAGVWMWNQVGHLM